MCSTLITITTPKMSTPTSPPPLKIEIAQWLVMVVAAMVAEEGGSVEVEGAVEEEVFVTCSDLQCPRNLKLLPKAQRFEYNLRFTLLLQYYLRQSHLI